MYTIILVIIIFVLAKTTLRGLFNRAWREKTQDIIWSIGNEKKFWYLMSQKINAPKVFFAYLRTRNQKDFIRGGDCVMNIRSYSSKSPDHEIDESDLNIQTIKKTEGIGLINNILNPKIQEQSKIIANYLTDNIITFKEDEIRKSFEEFDDVTLSGDVTNHYPRFMSIYSHSLIESDKTGVGIWKVLEDFVDKEHQFEDYAEKHDFLESLKKLQTDINNFVIDLICEKFENKEKSRKIKVELKKWHQLQLIRWCVIDYSVMRNLSLFNEKIWRIIIYIFQIDSNISHAWDKQ